MLGQARQHCGQYCHQAGAHAVVGERADRASQTSKAAAAQAALQTGVGGDHDLKQAGSMDTQRG